MKENLEEWMLGLLNGIYDRFPDLTLEWVREKLGMEDCSDCEDRKPTEPPFDWSDLD